MLLIRAISVFWGKHFYLIESGLLMVTEQGSTPRALHVPLVVDRSWLFIFLFPSTYVHWHTDGQTLLTLSLPLPSWCKVPGALLVFTKCDVAPFLDCVPSSANSPQFPPHPGPQSLSLMRVHTHTGTPAGYPHLSFPVSCGCMWFSLTPLGIVGNVLYLLIQSVTKIFFASLLCATKCTRGWIHKDEQDRASACCVAKGRECLGHCQCFPA